MKKQYFKHLPKFRKQAIECQKSFEQPIRQTFQRIKNNYNLLDCVKLQNLLQTQKLIRPIDDSLKKEIFKYFLQKEMQDFSFLKTRSKASIRIMKITKIKLEDTKLDWLQIWNRILTEFPQIGRGQNYQIQEFLKIMKIFFDQNNALDVFNYFIRKHGDHSQYVFNYILIFANITVNTQQSVFQGFLNELVQSYMRAQIKPKTMLIYFINLMKKRKACEIAGERYKLLKQIIMSTILTPGSKDVKSSVESKFSKQNAIMISQFIGRNNPYSEQIMRILFAIAQKFIFPFENSTKGVRFLYNLIRLIWKRMQRQRKAHIRLQKLIQKQEKLSAQKQQQKVIAIKSNQQQTAEQHPPSDQQVQLIQDQDELNEQQEQIESQQQKQKQQAYDQQLNNADEQLLSSEIEQKKNKCLKILKNQITTQIIDIVKDGVRKLFNYVYFVNSKKTVQQFIRYSFILMPQMIIKSLDLLDKASQIPYINEQGLVMNIQVTVQYMFSSKELMKESLHNLQRILDRIINCSKIIDVWPIYELLAAKIPLLDDRDLQKVSQQDKQLFEKKYELNHDRFYQYYSGNVYTAFKRMIREGEFFDQQTVRENSTCFEQLLLNSYPEYKKLLLKHVLQEIVQNRKNQFVYTFFNPHITLSPINQEIIDDQISLITENLSEENLQLKNNLVMLLCYNKSLKELKKYIREFATKNSYRVISMYYDIRGEFQLTSDPLNSAIKYFDQNPKFKFRTTKTTQARLQAIEEICTYRAQLLQELHKLVASPTSLTKIVFSQTLINHNESPEQEMFTYSCNLYRGRKETQSMAKITLETVGTRKKIIELLKLINTIQGVIKHKIVDFDNETMKFKSILPITKKRSLIENNIFMEIFTCLISDESYLHDVKLTAILSQLLTHELVFNYGNEVRQCKTNMNRNNLSNAYEELPDFCNRFLVMDSFKEKIMLIHSANLLNLVKKDRNAWLSQEKTAQQAESNQQFFDKVLNKIKILILAPGNQKSISLIKAILIITGLRGVNQFILTLYKQTDIESRFYWQKVKEIFEEFKNYGITFSVEQTVQLIDNHGKLFSLKDNKKLKQLSMESFKYLITMIREHENNLKQAAEFSNIERIEKTLRKHIDHEKLKLFWLLSVNFVLGSRKFIYFNDDLEKVKVLKMEEVWDFMQLLEPLILSDTRIVRRLALFVYSLCFRKIEKIVKGTETKKVQQLQYQPKTIDQFLISGYLRDFHVSEEGKKHMKDGKIETLKFDDDLMKVSPYDEYEVWTINTESQLYQIYKKIEAQAFEFILKNENDSLKFITNFHADMVSTAEQLLSIASSPQKQTELSELIVKELQVSFYYFVPKKLNFDKVEVFFGQRFFKYLMVKDSSNYCTDLENNFRFLFNPKVQDLLHKALLNLESLDNQALVLIICQDIFYAYQREFENISAQTKQKVEKFILDVYSEMSKKASGTIFKKFVYLFKKVQNQKALQFLIQNTRKQIFHQKRRVCRNAYVHLSIKMNDFNEHINVLKVLLENKIELQNTIVNKIINSILTHPQKYPIDKELALKYKFIDFQKELKDEMIEKSTQKTYIIRNTEFKEYLISTLRKYVSSTTENAEKSNEFVKNAYGLILNGINCFCHSYESEQNTQKISQLLDLISEMSLNKEQTQMVDYDQAEPYLKTIFSYQFEDIKNFETILKSVMRLVKVLSSKRQVEILNIILHRPYNFIRLQQEKYEEFLYEIFMLEETNNNYKALMDNLSVIMSFRMPPIEKFTDLIAKKCEVTGLQGKTQMQKAKLLAKNKKSKGKILLLYQCQQLALLKLDKQGTTFILNESTKDRKNIWCRQMLALRGKKEYLDDVETYHIWQGIKANSNPYNYIV